MRQISEKLRINFHTCKTVVRVYNQSGRIKKLSKRGLTIYGKRHQYEKQFVCRKERRNSSLEEDPFHVILDEEYISTLIKEVPHPQDVSSNQDFHPLITSIKNLPNLPKIYDSPIPSITPPILPPISELLGSIRDERPSKRMKITFSKEELEIFDFTKYTNFFCSQKGTGEQKHHFLEDIPTEQQISPPSDFQKYNINKGYDTPAYMYYGTSLTISQSPINPIYSTNHFFGHQPMMTHKMEN